MDNTAEANDGELFSQASRYYEQGHCASAVLLLKQLLAQSPQHAHAWLLLGMSQAGDKKFSEAVASCRQAIAIDPRNVLAHSQLARVLGLLGQFDEAIQRQQAAVQLQPESAEHVEGLHNLLAARETSKGLSLLANKQADEAEAAFRAALAICPLFMSANGNLGNLLYAKGELEEAARCYRNVIAAEPRFAQAHYDLAVVLNLQTFETAAEASLREALRHDARHVDALLLLAKLLAARGSSDEAAGLYRQALAIAPERADAHHQLGILLMNTRQFDEALSSFRAAVALRPRFFDAMCRLGIMLWRKQRLDEAIDCYRQCLQWHPESSEVHLNLGTSRLNQNRLDEAMVDFRRSLELSPDNAGALTSMGVALLTAGRLFEGWKYYEGRFRYIGMDEEKIPRPRWDGSDIRGKTILLRTEQGMGDAIQFVRYTQQIKQRGAHVLLGCRQPLVRLMQTCPHIDEVLVAGQAPPEFDVHLALMSLPRIFGTTLENIPGTVPYLFPDQALVQQWRDELSGDHSFKIGIAWQGNKDYATDYRRSFPLAQFDSIAATPGVRLYSLQFGEGRQQLADVLGRWPIVDLGDRLGDMHDTGAVVQALDLVITCDSSPAHLAGALGVPVWLAVAFSPDWRWLLDRTDTPWYPTMRLFRQPAIAQWDSVFAAMAAALPAEIERRQAT